MQTAKYDLTDNSHRQLMAINFIRQVGPIHCGDQPNQCMVSMYRPDSKTPVVEGEEWKNATYHKYHTEIIDLIGLQLERDAQQHNKQYPVHCHFTPALFDYSLFPKYNKGKKIGQTRANHGERYISGSSTFLFDLDGREKIGDEYHIMRTPEECVNQFNAFLHMKDASKFNIKYVLVNSGYGVHGYLPFNSCIPFETWKPIQIALIELMKTHNGLKPDEGVKDMGRVLRMPGTHNRKVPSDPKMVHTLIELDSPKGDFVRNDLDDIINWIKHNKIEIAPQRTTQGVTLPTTLQLEAGKVDHDSFDKLQQAFPDYRFAMDGARGGGALIGTKLSTVIDATKAILANPKYPKQFNVLYGQLMRAFHWQACKHEQDFDVCYQLAYIAMSHHPQFGCSDDNMTGEDWVASKWKYAKVDRANPVTWGTFWHMASESGYEHNFQTDRLPAGERQCFTSDHSKIGTYQDDPFFYINAWCTPNRLGEVAMDDLLARMKQFNYEPNPKDIGRAMPRFEKLHKTVIIKERRQIDGVRKTYFKGIAWSDYNPNTTFKMSPEQRDAVDRAVLHLTKDHSNSTATELVFRLFAMAGAGKTELIKYIVSETRSALGEKVDILILAPTNKASGVLRTKGNPYADTIHSKCRQVISDIGEPYKDMHDPEKDASGAFAFIIDECSMINNEIGSDLAKFGKPIVVVGDTFQLEAIQEGTEDNFEDEVNPSYYMSKHRFKTAPDVELQKIHRQGGMSRVLVNAWQLRNGRTFTDNDSTDDFQIVNANLFEDETYTKLLMHFSKPQNMIICGLNKTRIAINRQVRTAMGIDNNKHPYPRAGERLIVMQSCKEWGWFNGQIYEVLGVDHRLSDSECIHLNVRRAGTNYSPKSAIVPRIFFTGTHQQQMDFSFRVRNAIKLRDGKYVWFNYAYATSCHKSQGSQWQDVLVMDESASFGSQHRKWMYTAITRAENAVAVIHNLASKEAKAILGNWIQPEFEHPFDEAINATKGDEVKALQTPAPEAKPEDDIVVDLQEWKEKQKQKRSKDNQKENAEETPEEKKHIAAKRAEEVTAMLAMVNANVA